MPIIFNSGAGTVHNLDDYFFYSILQGNNVEKGEGEQLVHWLQNDFDKITSDVDTWYDFISKSSFSLIDTSYFEITPYSVEDMRKLSLFYSINFLHMAGDLPEAAIRHTMQERQARKISVMLNYHTKDTRNRHWSAFQINYPMFLQEKSVSFFDLLFELKDLTEDDFNILWHKLPKYTQDRDIGILNPKQQEVLKILSTVNLFAVAPDGFNTGRYIPLIGTRKECHVKKNGRLQPADCPIVFLKGESKEAFDAMKEFIQKRYLEQFCPLLSFEGGFSLNFIEYMQDSLQLKINNAGFKEYCSSSRSKNTVTHLPDGTMREYTIPRIFHEKILNDLFKMGKNPRLALGLSSLVGQIRFEKIMNNASDDKKILTRNILNSYGFLPPLLRAYSHHKLTDDRGFFC